MPDLVNRYTSLEEIPVGYEDRFRHRFRMVEAVFHAYAVGDYHPWFLEESPYGGPIVGLTMYDYVRPTWYQRIIGGPPAHQGMAIVNETEWHKPVVVGDEVDVAVRCLDRYVRNGRMYTEWEFEIHDVATGDLMVRHRHLNLKMEVRQE